MEKINIAELLKDCPKGMELDCAMYDDVRFIRVEKDDKPICIRTGDIYLYLTKYGTWSFDENAKCVIFPKGKTTWEGFVPPCKFNDGDIIYTKTTGNDKWLSIYQGLEGRNIRTYVDIHFDKDMSFYCNLLSGNTLCYKEDVTEQRLATEEEKQKLFESIKANGYKWNAETKTWEKLVEPKFKDGDRVRKIDTCEIHIIDHITASGYVFQNEGGMGFRFENEHIYELVPNKFDINTLKTFESRVLVRNSYSGFWLPAFWGIYETKKSNLHLYRNYLTTKGFFRHCIPYNDETKHLLGTTDDCDEYYKTWEE